MKIGLIVPVGMSAPIVTEAVSWVEGTVKRVNEVVMIGNWNPGVKANMVLAETSLRANRSYARIRKVELPFDDIGSDEMNLVFTKEIGWIIREMMEERGFNEVHLCISGGRKSMSASAALLGPFYYLKSVFHLIHTDVATMNLAFEKLRRDIDTLVSLPEEERMDYYTEHREDFDAVMFPPPDSIVGVNLLYLPYPREMLGKILTILGSEMTDRETGTNLLGYPMLNDLKRAGFVEITRKDIFTTEKGRTISALFR